MTLNEQRLQRYLDAEQRVLLQQEVTTAEGETLTLASLATIRKEIERLQRLIAAEKNGTIRRNYLE
ncbi:hypothetical protein [Celerinatantimonas sp. MCCC 1A17872]|uniref:hypothetical protein n=1 Tax=Celerinatantimonas sp. MCCC 1A17872 TaxID=3177514 RepID=UPI0038CA18EF